jgi:hypothetical protein
MVVTIRELEARVDQLRINLIHLDRTIELLDPGADYDKELVNARHTTDPSISSTASKYSGFSTRCGSLTVPQLPPATSQKWPSKKRVYSMMISCVPISIRGSKRRWHTCPAIGGMVERVGSHRYSKWKLKEGVGDLSAEELEDPD